MSSTSMPIVFRVALYILRGIRTPSWLRGSTPVQFAIVALPVIVLTFVAFDRLPLLSMNDEVIQNDPALTLAETGMLRAASFEGTLIGDLFAHYPPLYPILQAQVFRLFGLTAFSLRGLSLFAHIVTIILFASCLRMLVRSRQIRAAFGVPLFALFAYDVMTFSFSRWARAEPLMVAFALAGWALLLSRDLRRVEPARMALAAVCLGLSASCHPSALWFLIPFAVVGLFVWHGALWMRLVVVALPGLVALAVWVAVYGRRSVEALLEMLEINRLQGHLGIDFSVIFEALANSDFRIVMNRGGIALGVTIASWVICLAASGYDLLYRRSTEHPDTLFAGIVSSINVVLVFAATGVANTRLYGMLIVSVVLAGMVMSRFRSQRWVAATAIVALIEAGTVAAYIVFALVNYASRDPARSMAVVEGLNPKSRIGAPARLWFALRSQGHPMQVVEFGFVPSRNFYARPHALVGFDCVYLPEGHELLKSPDLQSWRRTDIKSAFNSYVRLDPPNPVNPCGPQRATSLRLQLSSGVARRAPIS